VTFSFPSLIAISALRAIHPILASQLLHSAAPAATVSAVEVTHRIFADIDPLLTMKL